MTTRSTLTGSVALMILMGALMLAAPAHAYVQNCDAYLAGTQAYGECMVRAEDREAAPIVPPSERVQGETTTTVVESSTAQVWQLGLAGAGGAVIAIGAALGVSRLGRREHATAH